MTLSPLKLSLVLALTLASGVVACASSLGLDKGSTGTASCDHRGGTGAAYESRCTDAKSVAIDTFKSSCTRNGGSVGATCSHDGSLGGCNQKNTDLQGNDVTDWYYPDAMIKTVDDVKAKCGGETFVTP